MAQAPRSIDAARLRQAAEKIVRTLADKGHVAYFAGGCVRDQIMGRPPTDYDVATDATPQQLLALFKHADRRGEAFGVVAVRLMGAEIEVATFRTESGYSDGRRPDQVQFTDAEGDAERRDFTINGLFYDPIADRLIDFVGGEADIHHGVVRAIGDPGARFAEDYLRMLRAVRFAARLGFEIDRATAQAIVAHAPKLAQISRERIGMELRMMMEHQTRVTAARLMQELTLDAPALNEPNVTVEPTCVEALDRQADFVTVMGAWMIDRHVDAESRLTVAALRRAARQLKSMVIVRHWRKALMLSNDERDGLIGLMRTLPQMLDWPALDTAQRKRLMARTDWMRLRQLLGAALALCDEREFDTAAFEQQCAELQQSGVAPDPLITGDNLIAAGYEPGPAFKGLLDRIYDAQLRGEISTVEQALTLAERLNDSGE